MKQLSVLIILLTAIAGIAQPLGDIIGTTYPTLQNMGRIAVCDDNTIYVCWMKLLGWPYPPAPRHIYYNWRDPDGLWRGECQVSQSNNSGSANFDINDNNCMVAIYHAFGASYGIFGAISWNPGSEFFDYFTAPNEIFPQTPDSPGICFWPRISVDRNNFIHLVMTESTDRRPMRFCYTRSENGGNSWTDVSVVDTVMVICGIAVSSPVSDKSAIVYMHSDDTTSQVFNWPNYVVSNDGQDWDFANGIVEVPYPEEPQLDLRAIVNIDAIIDYNDELHLAWPVYGDSQDWMLHYREGADTIETICQIPDTTTNHHPFSLLIDQVSLSRRENPPTLFATWCQYADGDTNTDGEYNGDIYICRLDNDGLTWETPVNITNSPSPDCAYGDCHSEIYPCAAEEADSLPHITYIYDPYISPDPGPDELQSVMYLGPEHLVGINQSPDKLPSGYSLSQNFPNPFNAVTTIRYNLPERLYVTLEIYNILGQKVESLLSDEQPAGYHTIEWQADDFSSGLYFYKIKAGEFIQTRSCLLLK